MDPDPRGAENGQLSVTEFRKVALRTGVTLNVALSGANDAPPVILLHGFPESHRTWREVAPRLPDDLYLVIPDQRGFAASDQPQEVEAQFYAQAAEVMQMMPSAALHMAEIQLALAENHTHKALKAAKGLVTHEATLLDREATRSDAA